MRLLINITLGILSITMGVVLTVMMIIQTTYSDIFDK